MTRRQYVLLFQSPIIPRCPTIPRPRCPACRAYSTAHHLSQSSTNTRASGLYRPQYKLKTRKHIVIGIIQAYQKSQRHFSSNLQPPVVKDVAILGGGITGLASAYYLTEQFPDAKITIYEKNSVLGGWMRSKRVDVGNGEVIFEQGPRTLRTQPPNGTLTIQLLQKLGLLDEVLITSKSSPAAQNRFVYYPDHLVRMPGPPQSAMQGFKQVLAEPIFKGTVWAVLKEYWQPTRPEAVVDESIGSFISRRFSKEMVNNIVSAVFHGIFSGDVWQLSAASILAQPYMLERRYGSFTAAFIEGTRTRQHWMFCDDVELQRNMLRDGAIDPRFRDCSVFTFKDGLATLARKLVEHLKSSPNVAIKTDTTIAAIESLRSDDVDIHTTSTRSKETTSESTSTTHSHVISTLPPTLLTQLRKSSLPTQPVRSDYIPSTATVGVVNLWYRTSHLLQKINPPGGLPNMPIAGTPLAGFGYLIPLGIPFSQNPERALGVIFDDDATPDTRNTIPTGESRGTRLTVMLGGHHWEGWSEPPSEADCELMARSVLKRHLGIDEEPGVIMANVHRDCIPQYKVGHSEHLKALHSWLQSEFSGRVRVAGSWFGGIGVNDCVRGAWDVVDGLKKGTPGVGFNGGEGKRTGLEKWMASRGHRPMCLVRRETGAESGVLNVVKVDQEAWPLGYFRDADKDEEDR